MKRKARTYLEWLKENQASAASRLKAARKKALTQPFLYAEVLGEWHEAKQTLAAYRAFKRKGKA